MGRLLTTPSNYGQNLPNAKKKKKEFEPQRNYKNDKIKLNAWQPQAGKLGALLSNNSKLAVALR